MFREIILLAIGAAFGLGATMSALAAPAHFPNAPPWVWHFLFWLGVALMALMVCDAICLIFWRPRLPTAILANAGLLLLAGAVIAEMAPVALVEDNEFIWFRVEISDPKDLTAFLPLRISNRHSGPFTDVNEWFCPWSSIGGGPGYDSIGWLLKSPYPFLHYGDYPYGKAIKAGDYGIEFDGTLHGITYHFVQRLNIHEKNGELIQSIQVRRWIGGKNEKIVFSSDDWRP